MYTCDPAKTLNLGQAILRLISLDLQICSWISRSCHRYQCIHKCLGHEWSLITHESSCMPQNPCIYAMT